MELYQKKEMKQNKNITGIKNGTKKIERTTKKRKNIIKEKENGKITRNMMNKFQLYQKKVKLMNLLSMNPLV
jgi:hypothetical protein